ncbi:MAG: universal stress protein [Desulfobacterales bacterium]
MRVEFKRILCGTDLSDNSNPAIVYGIALAREFQGVLTICHVVDMPVPSMYGEAYIEPKDHLERSEAYARERIQEIMAGQNIQWEIEIAVGNPADELGRIAREREADVALAATRGRRGLKRLLIGSVTERLIQTLPCPLLVVRGHQPTQALPLDGELRFRRLLVGCDFSPDADLALKHALSLAQEFEAELHLAHVIEPPTYLDLVKSEDSFGSEIRKDIQQLLKEKLGSQVPSEARNWCDPKTVLLEGRPEDELIRYAEANGIDLIILGVRGHGLIGSLFVGSTTDRIVRNAGCPVLAVCKKS